MRPPALSPQAARPSFAAGPILSPHAALPEMTLPAPSVRAFGPINWLGLWTLYVKEVRRFANVATQTILAPLVAKLLFLAIFVLALGRAGGAGFDADYAQFLAAGLIMMAMLQQAFANSSSSLVASKIQGNIVDLLMPPLSPGEIVLGLAGGGLTRGLVCGGVVWAVFAIFVPLAPVDLGLVLFHAAAASLMMSLLGILGGLWSEKFDHIAAVTSFVVTPLAFLSGTFYSIEALPPFWREVALWNPFFYMIDGFRYGLTGHADGSLAVGAAAMIAGNLALALLCHRLVAQGYKLRP